jgi:hypothetical protein
MDPMGVLASEYVRGLSAEQYADQPRRDVRRKWSACPGSA